MQHGKWLRSLAIIVSLSSLLFQSCRKENGIDNNNVIRTPYGLYFGDKYGSLYNTNDGEHYKLIFPSDGYAPRSIVTSATNIIWVKKNVHLSQDNGLNFNPTDSSAHPNIPWQSMLLDVPSHDRVYLCSNVGNGIRFSDDHGKTWKDDTNWDPTLTPAQPSSLAQLINGDLYAFSDGAPNLYKRLGQTGAWTEVVMTGLPSAAMYFISRFNNALLATDYAGTAGVSYSNDGGQNWGTYTGLPLHRLLSTYAPFDQTVLVGTDSAGVYRLQGNSFIASNNGLEPYTSVYGISAKQDIYKNDQIKQYIFIATSTGLYRSEDMGQNWVKAIDGDMRAIY